jgi:hypothetical protein
MTCKRFHDVAHHMILEHNHILRNPAIQKGMASIVVIKNLFDYFDWS